MMRIRSGGQSGVDRAALDCALELGAPLEGWVPAGGWAEDFPEPPGVIARYSELRETPSSQPSQRTEWNVRDSDATLILTVGGVFSPGTQYTIECAERWRRPHLEVDLDASPDSREVARWVASILGAEGGVLNVAGPRESGSPGIHDRARAFLCEALGELVR